jgi:PelA/Pel-15E family pectate lyase
VGEAFLRAYERTGERELLQFAEEAGRVLVRGQLQSGGWDYRIELDPVDHAKAAYRDQPASSGRFNRSTLDDDTTQSALSFLIRLDRALVMEGAAIHDAAAYGLDRLVSAQYANGAWPQRFEGPADPTVFRSGTAVVPSDWPREFPKADYRSYATLNDNVLPRTVETLFLAADVYGEPRFAQSACRAGDFLIAAQLPEPQPGWAQQYDSKMQPAWARKFEPPAATGGETQGAIRVLLMLFERTGEARFLEPIPRALDWLARSALPDGRVARFYELGTNRPLFFSTDYQLTYDDSDLPTHYGFKVDSSVDRLRRDLERARTRASVETQAARRPPRLTDRIRRDAQRAYESLDEEGRWLSGSDGDSPARRRFESREFIRNLDALSVFVEAVGNRE